MVRIVATASTFLLAALWSSVAMAQPLGDRDFWWHPGLGWGHMMFGGLMMIVFWGGVIVLIVLLVRLIGVNGGGGRGGTPMRPTALEILQERFAKGEIDKQEYEERRKLLQE